MFKINSNTFEAEKGISIHNFSEELIKIYNRCGSDITGIFNDIKLSVNQYENSMSLYWQYMYKKELQNNTSKF
jgi:hypothetical protein